MKIIQHNSYEGFTPSKENRVSCRDSRAPSTILIEGAPEWDALVSYLSRFLEGEVVEIPLVIGVARCHPNDDYNRKTGLETAQKNIKQYSAKIDSMWMTNQKIIEVGLKTFDGDLRIRYVEGKRPQLRSQTFTLFH